MPLHHEIVRTETAVSDAKAEIARIRLEITDRNRAEYVAAGGCLGCNGTHSREAVDMEGCYMGTYPCTKRVNACGERVSYDGMRLDPARPSFVSYDVYLACKEVPCDSPLMPYGGDGAQHDADKRALTDAEESLAIAKEQYERAVNLYDVVTGSTVRVVKGRKVKVGTVGVVTGLYDGQWGTRVGIRVKDGEKPVYTALDNVLVVSSSFEQEHDLPDLYGSPKQVSWALKIRGEALRSGKVTIEAALHYTSAKIWIDDRDRPEAMQERMAEYLKGVKESEARLAAWKGRAA